MDLENKTSFWKTALFWIIVAIVVLLIVVLILRLPQEQVTVTSQAQEPNLETLLRECVNNSLIMDNAAYTYCEAVAQRDAEMCDNDGVCLMWVYSAEAWDKKDINICDQIAFQPIGTGFCQALFTKEDFICETAGDDRDICTSIIENIKDDLSEDEIMKVCKAGPKQRSTGFYCKALLIGKEDNCNDAWESGCYSTYYTLKAQEEHDSSYCDFISASSKEIDYCKTLSSS
jgi:hypothetical protein